MNTDIKKARIKINSEEERLILKGFFELQGWRPSDMRNWNGTFPFYGYDENFGKMNSWPEGTTSGVCYASLNDFFLKKPIVKYKEFKLNDEYTAHIYPDKVMVGDIKVSFDTIQKIISNPTKNFPEKFAVRTPTQELLDLALNQLKFLYPNNKVRNITLQHRNQTAISLQPKEIYYCTNDYFQRQNWAFVEIADLFLSEPYGVKINDTYTAVVKGDLIKIGCQTLPLSVVKELAALLPF